MSFIKEKKRDILGKYINLPVPMKAAVWFVICNILQKGISMITIPIFTRLLTAEEYGLFSIYQSWYSIIGILASLNLQDATFNTGMVKYPKEKDNFTLSLQSLTTLLTLILFAIYLVGINFWNDLFELPTVLMFTMLVELLFIPAYSFWSARQKFEYKYVALILSTLFIATVCPSVAVLAIHFSQHKGEARIMSFTLIQAAVGLVFYVLNLYRGKKLIKLEYWKYALSFSVPLIPHYFSMTVLQQADRIMIGKMIGNGEAAIYSIAYNVSQLILLVTKAINNSYIPYTYRCIQNKKYDDLKKNSKMLLLLISGMMIALMLVGPEIIRIFATPDYYDAIWIIPPVSMSAFFLFLYPMFSNIEFYFEKSSIAMGASILGAVVNIILNFIFIPKFGYIAAGYTTVFCYLLFAVMHYWGMKKVLRQQGICEQVYDVKFIFTITMLMFIVMICVLVVYPFTFVRYLIVFILCIVGFVFRKKIIKVIKDFKER